MHCNNLGKGFNLSYVDFAVWLDGTALLSVKKRQTVIHKKEKKDVNKLLKERLGFAQRTSI